MIEKIGGRKFIYAILAVLLAFGLTLAGQLKSADFISFVEVIGGIYVIGNLGTKLTSKL